MTKIFDQFDVTDQEQQFLEIMRDMNKRLQDVQVVINRIQGVWDVTMKELGTERIARGTGATFDEAWNNVTPIQFEP
jgi:hypothetical protein